MRSSEGSHFVVLDQMRGIAAYLVVMWHFLHSASGLAAPVPYEGAPLLALIDEGHTGVALFMCLSGYLFAKLCEGRRIHYRAFLANRALRLFPLLFFIFAMIAALSVLKFGTAVPFALSLLKGLVLPLWSNGGWSIAVEMHFYLVLPLLLVVARKHVFFLPGCLLLAILLRAVVFETQGTVQHAAYLTIVGRFDQFVLGIMAWQHRHRLSAVPMLLPILAAGFAAFYWWFDWMGGFRDFAGLGYPNRSAIWVIMPTIEGAAYAAIIALCDNRFAGGLPLPRRIGAFLAAAGTYSYSIYLLHFFAVDRVAMAIHRAIDISGFYPALAFGTAFFVAMTAVGRLSYRCIEQPFLRYRVRYLDRDVPQPAGLAGAT